MKKQENIEIIIANTKVLKELHAQGFEDTGKRYAYDLRILKGEKETILYNETEDSVFLRYDNK